MKFKVKRTPAQRRALRTQFCQWVEQTYGGNIATVLAR